MRQCWQQGALEDLKKLGGEGEEIEDRGDGRYAIKTADGRTANVHPSGPSDKDDYPTGTPTLELPVVGVDKIKVRYPQ